MKEIEELKVQLQQVTLERDRLKEDNHQEVTTSLISDKKFPKKQGISIRKPLSDH